METMTTAEVDLMAVEEEEEAVTAVMWTATTTATIAAVAGATKPALAGMKKTTAMEVAMAIHTTAAETIVGNAQLRRTTSMAEWSRAVAQTTREVVVSIRRVINTTLREEATAITRSLVHVTTTDTETIVMEIVDVADTATMGGVAPVQVAATEETRMDATEEDLVMVVVKAMEEMRMDAAKEEEDLVTVVVKAMEEGGAMVVEEVMVDLAAVVVPNKALALVTSLAAASRSLGTRSWILASSSCGPDALVHWKSTMMTQTCNESVKLAVALGSEKRAGRSKCM